MTAGCILLSRGTKALYLNGVFPEGLWPSPYCSITGVAQLGLVGAALRVVNKISVVTTAIITEPVRKRYMDLFFTD